MLRGIDGKSTTGFFKQTKISLRIYIAVDVIIYVESLPGISITIFFQSNMTSMKLCKIGFYSFTHEENTKNNYVFE